MNRTALSELTSVTAVAAHRSFRGAAKELGMSPSSLSHAVAALEQRMGVRLFHRTTRSVSLTEAGEQFLARISPALREISAAMDEANTHRETPTGTLRINASEGAAMRLMNPVVYEFLRRYPDMKLDIVTDARMVDIVAEGFDAGVRQTGHVPQDMIAVPCSPAVRFSVVGSPAYFARRPKPKAPDDLRAHECIRARLPGGAPYKWQFGRRGERIDIEAAGALTLDNPHLMRGTARQCARRLVRACARPVSVLPRTPARAGGPARIHRSDPRMRAARHRQTRLMPFRWHGPRVPHQITARPSTRSDAVPRASPPD